MTYRKKLIEVALPLVAINEASAYEKMPGIGAHPRGIHLWWARRPLTSARAVIFASLVDDPDSPDALPAFVDACRMLPKGKNAQMEDTPRQRLFDFIERLVQWSSSTDETVLTTARKLILIATEGNPPPLLDPFAGGGSIPLEAQRLGLEAFASDLNPVAVAINKAQIEIPPRFIDLAPVNPSNRDKIASGVGWKGVAGLATDVRYYGDLIHQQARKQVGHLYPTYDGKTVIAWLWTRTVKSPNPAVNVPVPLVRSFELSKKKGRRSWIEPIVDTSTKHVSFIVRREQNGDDPKTIPDGTVNRRGARCIVSGTPIPLEYVRAEGKAGRIGSTLLAIVAEGTNGRNYYAPTLEHATRANVEIPEDAPDTKLPEQALGFRVQNYGLTKHRDLFTPRQLVVLTTLSDLVNEVREHIYQDALISGLPDDDKPLNEGGCGARAYSEAVSVYLAFAVDRCADFNNTIVRWVSSNEKVMNLFGRQTISMTWDYGEPNLMERVVGGWPTCVAYIAECLETLRSASSGKVKQADAANLDSDTSVQLLVSTDPPYYDNVSYADLSDFFYIWMRRTLKDVYADIFGTLLVPKDAELIADPYRFGGRDAANTHFERGMGQVFTNLRQKVSDKYPITIYYAFKQSESEGEEDEEEKAEVVSSTGWETMLEGLVHAGFMIDGTWPMRTEQISRLRNMSSNALASSIVLVCRPRLEDAPTISRRAFVDSLRRELPAALKEMQSGNIAPVDLAQASIGPGIAIYSRYSKVLEADGTPMSVRTALGIINQELDAYLAEQDGDIDADTRFAVAWFTEYGFETGEYGRAETLATAKNVSVSGIERAGIVQSGRGKVKLLHWKEYDPGIWDPQQDKRPTVWEATHHLIERLNSHGETGSAMLMTKMPHDMAAEARHLAYRLYSICERKGWSDHARDYNALVISWAGIGEETARLREAEESGQATEQPRLL
ncbi:MAG: DUF1156 domain-containing protein [Chloroflexota bacterium]